MKTLITLVSMLLMIVLISSCEKQTIDNETGIEEVQKPQKLIDKDEIEPGSRG
ncbi:hypothetical protein [Aquimarina longa]|uniref:hypothetical protein n=1 Tax=Aquimarina longa TaxID=1080221 RepID=UPI00130EA731|nr:hypothetical protein [Aquimarina longa]